MGVIYKITNTIDNKIYIGQTTNLTRRINEYKIRKPSHSKKYNYNMTKIISEIGFENFTFEKLFETDDESELNDKEKFFILKYKSNDPNYGYNSSSGGKGRGFSLNSKTRELMKQSHVGLKESAITKRKKSNKMIAFKDDIIIVSDSGKLFGDYIGKSKDMVSHAISKKMKIAGYYVFKLTSGSVEDYSKARDKKYGELYKLVVEGLETIEKTNKDIIYLKY